MKIKIYERDIKKQILSLVQHMGIYANNTRNTGTFNPRAGRFIPAPCKGIPDICGYFGKGWGANKGRAVYIEVKSPTGKVSPHQQYFIDEAKENGCFAMIAWDVNSVIEELAKWKL